MLAKVVKTGQGKKVYPFKDADGVASALQESSALGLPKIRIGHLYYDVNGKPVGDRLHLTQSQVQSLLPFLRKFVRTGAL